MSVDSDFIGKYVGGNYIVHSELEQIDATITAVHEEMHGILRRSTGYGQLLLDAQRLLPIYPEESFWIHLLSSRARTSEEVHATYQSIRQAIHFGHGKAAQLLIDKFPSYKLYYNIGNALVGAEPRSDLANIFLDSIVRFCWSPAVLSDVPFPLKDFKDLKKLPTEQFPDERFKRVRSILTKEHLYNLLHDIFGERLEALLELFSVDPRHLSDPMGAALNDIIPEGFTFMASSDFERQRLEIAKSQSIFYATMLENTASALYDALVANYQNTSLEALPTSIILDRD